MRKPNLSTARGKSLKIALNPSAKCNDGQLVVQASAHWNCNNGVRLLTIKKEV
jgi:hypothetical protein